MIEDLELTLLLEGIYQHYGYDFRNYARASIKRRIRRHMGLYHITSISQLQDQVLHDKILMQRLLVDVSVHVTEMFRDPDFYRAFRETIVPWLRTFPIFHIWHAGCSTGKEVYSLAILLHEEGLLEHARIYASDIQDGALKTAREGIYPIERMKDSISNYRASGGQEDFSEYFIARYGSMMLSPDLRKHISFCNHNLATDAPFQSFDVILCRNVMIYFNDDLKSHALNLFHKSLNPLGLLAVGLKESVHQEQLFDTFDRKNKIYRKIGS